MTRDILKMIISNLLFRFDTSPIIINIFCTVVILYMSVIKLITMVYRFKKYLFCRIKEKTSLSPVGIYTSCIFLSKAPTTHLSCTCLRTFSLLPLSLRVITFKNYIFATINISSQGDYFGQKILDVYVYMLNIFWLSNE